MNVGLYTAVLILLLSACQPFQKQGKGGPEVLAIYPSADTLPENLLRMYIQFSTPMKAVGNLEKIQLYDEHEKEVKGAIFNNVYELWNRDQTLLTLIFDPARVKTGLVAHENLGHALKVGKNYRLHLEGLEDITHQPLRESFTKMFSVISADTVPPAINDWLIEPPLANTKNPLKIGFPDMLDLLSLKNRLAVVNAKEEVVEGEVVVGESEQSWAFIPQKKWEKGTYLLMVHTRLEDPSGNNSNGLFDHPVGSLRYENEDQLLKIPFELD